jgi:hypothetical protein
MAPNSIISGHGSRGTPSSGSRPDRHDDEQRDRSALPSGITAIALASVLLLVATVLTTTTSHPGDPHGVTDTHEGELNNDLLEFLKS